MGIFNKRPSASGALLRDGDTITGSTLNSPTLNGAIVNVAQGADLASAATVNLGAATGNFVKITGSTAITSFGTATAGVTRSVMFTGALTLTYNATAMILPTGVSIATAVGDTAEFTSLGSGNWVCTSYVRASGAPLGNAGLAAKLNPSAVLDVAYSQTSGNSANYNHPGGLLSVYMWCYGGDNGGSPQYTGSITLIGPSLSIGVSKYGSGMATPKAFTMYAPAGTYYFSYSNATYSGSGGTIIA